MVNYANAKVYKIEPICEHDDGDIYVGSTTKQYLSQRMDTHRKGYKMFKKNNNKYVTAYAIFDKYGIENCHIILIENLPCDSKDQLFSREGFHIRSIKCVNKVIIGRSNHEYYIDNIDKRKEYNKIYYLDNSDKIRKHQNQYYADNTDKRLEYNKQYRVDNSDIIKTKMKQYRKDNADMLKEKIKQYREDNIDMYKEKEKQYYKNNAIKIKEKNSVKYDCQCGGSYIYCHKSTHFKTKKHQDYILNNPALTTP